MPLSPTTFANLVTLTRASTGTYFDATGTLQSAGNNVARFDYDPSTLAPRGFLIEEQRTNSIRNNTMQGAVAGTPGTLPTNWSTFTALTGLTRTIVGTGTENGITYVDIRISGTPSAAGLYGIYFEGATQIVAASGQTWISSAYIKLASGSLTGISLNYVLSENNNVGGFLVSSATPVIPTGSALSTQRATVSRTLNQATTAFTMPYIDLVISGVAIDITLRIGLPQLELGAFATSVIPTSTVAVTRNADGAVVNTLSPWFNASAGTLYAEGVTFDSAASSFPRLAAFSDNTNSNVIQIVRNTASGQSRYSVSAGGASQAASDIAAWTLNTVAKIAVRYETNDFAAVQNGGTVTTDTSGSVPVVTSLKIGVEGSGTASFTNGWLRRIQYYPRGLTNAELQTLTT